jgi:PPOX class probable F420-dependent enzyme
MGEAKSALEGENYINLETFKRDGTGVKTPIWFAPDGDGWVFFTDGRSWKVKRLRRDARVRFAACNVSGKKVRGPWFEGRCQALEDPEAVQRANHALNAKYGLSMRGIRVLAKLGGRHKHWAYFRIQEGAQGV